VKTPNIFVLLVACGAVLSACNRGDAPGAAPEPALAVSATDTPAVRLNTEIATAWFDAASGLAYLLQSRPELRDSLAFPPDEPTAVTAARFRRIPQAIAVLDSMRLTAEQYVAVAHTLFATLAVYDARGEEAAVGLPPGPELDNLKFVALRRFWIHDRIQRLSRGGEVRAPQAPGGS
jgi:hypothetical protein